MGRKPTQDEIDNDAGIDETTIVAGDRIFPVLCEDDYSTSSQKNLFHKAHVYVRFHPENREPNKQHMVLTDRKGDLFLRCLLRCQRPGTEHWKHQVPGQHVCLSRDAG